ncbi:hypothetical protein VOLCADRAFT_121289 [Volvox carteri f. nagariensis]|uniref:ATPase n=1 Tax=Volvox carteri f. nagariensis TaxID=3068 RepID=D8U6K2_VOLCA|nr:uncharacterized protein VOLCADRAFT_121289 [Volvox carteri f. nagariensis]EFJ44661.1 hypothetical protein VOLCADRAFT_121289 [Volvox carteri f. nagariensis]|eukprot:XP_002954237.1 hypothetical protein VOLCADRAFT_121289 [Volvox carteri f. nagariensis]
MILGPVLRKRCTLSNLLKADGAGARVSFSCGARDDANKTHVGNLLASYQRLLQRGSLLPDATQAAAVRALQLLQDAVLVREAQRAARQNDGGGNAGSTSSDGEAARAQARYTTDDGLDAASYATPPPAPPPPAALRGAYLWGPVGSGKTAVMDLFAETTRVRLEEATMAVTATEAEAAAPPLQQQQQQQLSAAAVTASASASASASARFPAPIGDSRFGGTDVCIRQHFHEFMLGVHGRLHELQVQRPRIVARSRQGMLVYRYAEPEEDPLITVAREWGRRTAVLCLDELHVTDVADAMILSRLFGSLLLDFRTTVLFTSNRPPNDLYKGGLSRKYFEPFVRLVDEQMLVLRVAAEVDYRRRAAAAAAEPVSAVRRQADDGDAVEGTAAAGPAAVTSESALKDLAGQDLQKPPGRWLLGSGAGAAAAAEERLRSLWDAATGDRGGGGVPVVVPLAYGRTLKVPYALGDAAWFTFEQLCGAVGLRAAVDDGGALAAPCFLALCRHFRELYITGVPELGPAQRDEARRFVTLLDVAYDNKCRLVVAASVPPDALFAPLLEEARRQGIYPRLSLPKTASQAEAKHHQGANTATGAAATTTSLPPAAASAVTTEEQPTAARRAAAASDFVVPSATPPLPSTITEPTASQGPPRTHIPGSSSAVVDDNVHPSEFTGAALHGAAPSQPRPSPADLAVPRFVLGEEVLMYHRAMSRLAEMCSVVSVAGNALD